MNKNILSVNSQNFQEMVESSAVVFVDFYADWCGPCKVIAPSIDKLAEQYDGTVKFLRLDIDQNPEVARKFDVRSIPTLIIFLNGKPVRRMIGASPLGHYRGELGKVVTKMRNRTTKNLPSNPRPFLSKSQALYSR